MGAQADKVRAQLDALMGNVVRDLTLEIEANLIRDCPVDTGHTRRNMVPSIGAPHEGEDDGAAQAAGQAAVLSYQIGQGDTYVVNNVPYIGRLILGSSAQAPAGWDLVAVDEAQQTIQARYGNARIEVTSSRGASERGGAAAQGVADAFSPVGGEE